MARQRSFGLEGGQPRKEDPPVPFKASSSISCQDYYETLNKIQNPKFEARNSERDPNFGSQPFFFPLSPSIVKVQIFKVPFSSEDPMWPIAFCLIFLLDRAFFFPYTLSIKKEILIKQAVCAGAGDSEALCSPVYFGECNTDRSAIRVLRREAQDGLYSLYRENP